jgi:hypothetical protein
MIVHRSEGGTVILMVVSIVVAACGWTLICLYHGFRAGRIAIGQPMGPILPARQVAAVIDEDPFYEAMHGRPQPRSTIPGE